MPLRSSIQITLIVVPTILLALATVCVVLRFYARHLKKARALADDYFCILALILAYGQHASVLAMVLGGGMGLPYPLLSMPTLWILFRTIMVDYVLWVAAAAAVQLSILLLYSRIFGVNEWFRKLCYAVMFIITAWAIVGVSTRIFACGSHISKDIFTANPTLAGTCIDEIAVCESIGLLHVIFDFLVLGLPLPLIWRLRVGRGTKILLSLLLCVGVFASITSILRMQCMIELIHGYQRNPTLGDWESVLYQSLEVPLGIICVCVPTFPALGTKISSSRFGSYVKSWLSSAGLSSKKSSASSSKEVSGASNTTTNSKNFQRLADSGSKVSQDSQIPLAEMENGGSVKNVHAVRVDHGWEVASEPRA